MSDLAPETLAQMLTRTRARLTTFGDSTCTESVVRRGRGEPCGKPAVALRDDREFDVYSPVCARHTRGFCIPVMDRADMHALLDAATERDALAADADKWQRAALTLQGDRDALGAKLAHMTEARDNARTEVERLTGQIEAAKRIGLGTHLGRTWPSVLNDMLRALDGEAGQ